MTSLDTIPITLDLIGSKRVKEDPVCRRVMNPAGGYKLQLSMQPIVELGHAQRAAGLLLQGIQDLRTAVASQLTAQESAILCSVQSIQISELQFTPDGAGAIMMFLATQSSTLKSVHIHYAIPVEKETVSERDTQALSCLALAFEDANLEVIDLSHNALPPEIWLTFSSQKQLQTLILEDVNMSDECLVALDEQMEANLYTGALSRLWVSNRAKLEQRGVDAASNVLYRCTNLRQLRWAYYIPPNQRGQRQGQHDRGKDVRLPCRGINDLAQRMFRLQSHLRVLELEGAALTDLDCTDARIGLFAAFHCLPRLTHLKLKALSITPSRLSVLITALQNGGVPLKKLDLSANRILDEGAKLLTQLADFRTLATRLEVLDLEETAIGNDGAIALFVAWGIKGREDLDIRLNGNPINMSKVAISVAASFKSIELERDNIRKERDEVVRDSKDLQQKLQVKQAEHTEQVNGNGEKVKEMLTAQASMVADMQALQKQVATLTVEKEKLMGAFSVLGATQAVEERNSTLERIARLEEAVHGARRAAIKYPTSKTRKAIHPESTRQIPDKDPEGSQRRRRSPVDDERIADNLRDKTPSERNRDKTQGDLDVTSGRATESKQSEGSSDVATPTDTRTKAQSAVQAMSNSRKEDLADVRADIARLSRTKSGSVRGSSAIRDGVEKGMSAHSRESSRSDVLRQPQRQESQRYLNKPDRRQLLQRQESIPFAQRHDSLRYIVQDDSSRRLMRQDSLRVTGGVPDISSGPEVTQPERSSSTNGRNERPGLARLDRSFKAKNSSSDRFEQLVNQQFRDRTGSLSSSGSYSVRARSDSQANSSDSGGIRDSRDGEDDNITDSIGSVRRGWQATMGSNGQSARRSILRKATSMRTLSTSTDMVTRPVFRTNSYNKGRRGPLTNNVEDPRRQFESYRRRFDESLSGAQTDRGRLEISHSWHAKGATIPESPTKSTGGSSHGLSPQQAVGHGNKTPIRARPPPPPLLSPAVELDGSERTSNSPTPSEKSEGTVVYA
eukprot:Nitzschia sp. Nitz4//scaffold129_size63868//23342//26395//NITZ4_006197-RA/size63868-processed-gene-0.59-mRNA-1//1//CDS//3329534899//671//frame0